MGAPTSSISGRSPWGARFFQRLASFDETRVRKNFSEALEKAELPRFRVYDLRHTFASLLRPQGAPITYVAAQFGHSRPTTTLEWYATGFRAAGSGSWTASRGPKPRRKGPAANRRGHQLGTKRNSGASDAPEAPETFGGPSRTRTLDPLIKSEKRRASRGHTRRPIPLRTPAPVPNPAPHALP